MVCGRAFGHVLRGSGPPSPVAGRSLRPSWPPLTACPLRSGILPALAPTARLSGRGQPLPRATRDRKRMRQEKDRHATRDRKRTGMPPGKSTREGTGKGQACHPGKAPAKRTGTPHTPGARSLWRASVPASRAWRRGLPHARRPAAPAFGHVLRGSGPPSPVAGRSLRPSWPPLTACPLRSGILPALAPTARLSGHGQPLPRATRHRKRMRQEKDRHATRDRKHPRKGQARLTGKRTGTPHTPGARSLWRASVPASRTWRRGLPHARRPAAPAFGHVLRRSGPPSQPPHAIRSVSTWPCTSVSRRSMPLL